MGAKATKEDITAIQNDTAVMLGEGEWIKGGAFRVYQIEDRYISIVVVDQSSLWLEYDTAEYITKDQINDFIDYEEPVKKVPAKAKSVGKKSQGLGSI